MVYYDTLVKTIESSLPNGSSWIPELVVVALLSEWIIDVNRLAVRMAPTHANCFLKFVKTTLYGYPKCK